MKIPIWLLRLLPMWDYICPKCRKPIKKNSHKCIHCGEQCGCPVRVPSRVLKDTKSLEEYVHKYVFPRVSKAQRDYLAQYFTELFSDGFESGDFSEWTGTNGIPTIATNPVKAGSYSMLCDASGECVYKGSFDLSEFYHRFYVYISELPDANAEQIELIRAYAGSTYVFSVSVRYVSPNGLCWVIRYYNGASAQVEHSYTTINVDTWYCVEAYWENSASATLRLWVDGDKIIEVTGKDTNNYGNVDTIRQGITYYSLGGESSNVYADCVVIADTYIGPESETYTKTWATDALFKKLGIAKSLSVDVALQKQGITETAQVDALFKKLDVSKQFGADADFQKFDLTKSLSLDVAFRKAVIKAFSLDANFLREHLVQRQVDTLFQRRGIVKSAVVDAAFQKSVSNQKQIDAIFKRLDATKTFGLNVYFGSVEPETYAKNFALDVIFAYKVRLPELWLAENGKIVLNVSKPYIWVGN